MAQKKLFCAFVCFCFYLITTVVFASDQTQLDTFIKISLDNNTHIKETLNQWKASEQKAGYVKVLDDPMFSYAYFGENVQTRVGPQEHKYSISQKIPFPGKLTLKSKSQSKHAEMLKQKYEAARREVIKNVKLIYYDIYWIDKSLQINREEKDILENIEKVSQRRYESNLTSQQEVIKIQVELSKIIQKLLLLKQNRESLTAKLNNILNIPPQNQVDTILNIKDITFEYDLDSLIDIAQKKRQEILLSDLSVEKSQYEKSLAKMSCLPDFKLGVDYIRVGSGTTNSVDDGQDAWIGMLSVNIPVWFGKSRSKVREKDFQLKAAVGKKEDLMSMVQFETQDMFFKIKAYEDILNLHETALLPQARQAFDASQIGFETGSVSFIDWLDTQRTYLQARLAYHKIIADYNKSMAYLERVIGQPLLGDENEK